MAVEEATHALLATQWDKNEKRRFRPMRYVTRRLHLQLAMPPSFWAAFFIPLLAGCATGPPEIPYPAFVQTDTLADVFVASLPGVRAKQFSSDPATRRSSNRIDLPPGWNGSTGGAPGKLLELYVLEGELDVGDIKLVAGGYLYAPPGALGFNLHSKQGARILYYLDDADPLVMIRTPAVLDSNLLDWSATSATGVSIKELRNDPGNGARTWLQRVDPGAAIPWYSSTAQREGYLASGRYQETECIDGKKRTWTYARGGYFLRPARAVSGGPESGAMTESVWVLRERAAGIENTQPACGAQP
jgi:hypothetical protein